jgi:prephenate dehydratase
MKKIAYLGPSGTYAEEAALLYGEASGYGLVPVAPIYDLILAVDNGEYDEAVVPLENSIEGSLGLTLDMLVKEVRLFIKKEIILPIHHYLLGKAGTKLKDITDIISHPQALAQCHTFLHQRLKRVRIHPSESTAQAVELVSSGQLPEARPQPTDRPVVLAAIGSLKAAQLYQLEILADNINDYQDNSTRFVVLAKEDGQPTGNDKTSIVFSSLKDKPGALYELLGEFARRNINLTRIESRPSKKMLGDYLFFVDLKGHRTEALIVEALKAVEKHVSYFKMLGSYPKF